MPGVDVLACETGAEAKQQLETGAVDLITTALRLPDMDGLELARYVREHAPQAYIPIVIVSGDVNERLINRELSEHVTDYFDKSLGFNALSAFIRGYVRPAGPGQRRRAVRRGQPRRRRRRRDACSKSTASPCATSPASRMPWRCSRRRASRASTPGVDVVLSDVNLKGELTGGDLLDAHPRRVRLRQGRAAGADHDRRRQSGQSGRAAARRRERSGAEADRGAPADHQADVPDERRRAHRCRRVGARASA